MSNLILSDKYKRFIECKASVEFLEGTTFAGKTTVGMYKFMLKVGASPQKLHIIAAKDTGTAEKNIINKDLGIIDNFGVLTEYHGNGTSEDKIPHIVLHASKGDKIIYVMGYGDKQKWQKALGGQYGCLYIDEINTANIEFVREASMRCDYFMATLNPDDPNLPVYQEYINASRPLPEWEAETPAEILEELKEEPKPNWVHWFFSFDHNLGLTKDKLNQIITNVPKGTKIYKNKILGLRGKATGLVFDLQKHNIITANQAKEYKYQKFSCGVDTSFSSKSPDTIAFIFEGITECGKEIILDERVYNNRDLAKKISPSDIPPLLVEFLEENEEEWGFAREVWIDSADQGTILECQKYKRDHGLMYQFGPAFKRTTIMTRIKLQGGWMANGYYLILEHCKAHIGELNIYSWQEDKDAPEDRNDHTINAAQYGWMPYKDKIGGNQDAKAT